MKGMNSDSLRYSSATGSKATGSRAELLSWDHPAGEALQSSFDAHGLSPDLKTCVGGPAARVMRSLKGVRPEIKVSVRQSLPTRDNRVRRSQPTRELAL